MTNQIKDIIIGVLILVMCVIITLLANITFWWIFLPVFFIVLLLILSKLLKERFGKTYGIVYYLGAMLFIPAIWYIFCSNMPMTSIVADNKRKSEDLSAFKDYQEGIDAKKQVAEYQMKQDSILKEQVSQLLKDGKVDSALKLIKENATSSQKIKDELFSSISPSKNNQQEQKSDINHFDNASDNNQNTKQQYAIINDPDGYTNVRNGPGPNFSILGIVRDGEIFEVSINKNSEWWVVKSKGGLSGYMHRSRIKLYK